MAGVKQARVGAVGILTLDEPESPNAMTPVRSARLPVATRALVEESEHTSYEAQFRREIELQAIIRTSADAIEGPKAFVEKRKAKFTGK
ncbi:enoyl-CoA hydratase/carnithine racemase [Bradyrhizobium sp. S3.12.5]|uniref:hypothetical protein n=1 Tax=Bradyrhizobium sp. S3.12.5 TaxID=3156386 RepID=UPI003399E79A